MNVSQRIESLLNWLTPDELKVDLHVKKRVHMFLISHVLGPFVAAPIPIFLALRDPEPLPHVAILSASIFGFWAFLPAIKLLGGHHYRGIAMLSVTNFTFAILWGAYNYGGASSPFLTWFLVMPLVAFFYSGADNKTRAFVFSQIALGLGALYGAYLFGGAFPVHIPSEQLVSVGIVSAFSSATYVFFMAAYYSNVVDSQSALLREIEEHKNTLVQLQQSKEIAERASKAKSEFLAKMSHELRTPLNAVLGYTEILLEDAEIEGNGQQVADLNKISSAGQHLLAMVNDILDISKIEAGRMELSIDTLDFAKLISEIEHTARPLATKNANQLLVERDQVLGKIEADPTKLRQIIFNLLSNAAKFTQNGTITLKARSLTSHGQDLVAVEVSDTGIGISPEHLDNLFSNFGQADAKISAVYGGTGLGLSLSRNMARLMGGDIKVTSSLGEGSTFAVYLPRVFKGQSAPLDVARLVETAQIEDEALPEMPDQAQANKGQLSGGPSARPTGESLLPANAEAMLPNEVSASAGLTRHTANHKSRKKILLVDDDLEYLELAERVLDTLGYSAISTAEGAGALQLARTLQPDAVFLDILMPQIGGWEVLQSLRADPATRDLPVIMVSAVDEGSLARQLGSDGFLPKPLNPNQVAALMRSLEASRPKTKDSAA